LLKLIDKKFIKSAHDVSLGGIITALSKMCIKGKKGATLKKPNYLINQFEYLFGEDQGRYLLACEDSNALIKAAEISGIPAQLIGHFGGKEIKLGSASIKINDVADAHESILKSLVN